MPAFAHAPYATAYKPFSIGLTPLDLKDWLLPDERLLTDLAEKDALLAEKRDIVFAEEPGTRASQQEVLDLVVAHLLAHFPDRYRRDGAAIVIDGTRRVALDADEAPFLIASRLMQEDLVLMGPSDTGYRLIAAALCFPSAWSLREKFGQNLDGIHAAVPGYADGMGTRMNRIFAALKTELPVWRWNWSIYPDPVLHHPESKARPRDWFGRRDDEAFIRIERQTLRRLPGTGDILFTIKVATDPIAEFRTHPEGARMAAGLREQVLMLSEDQLRYKALAEHRDAIAARLAEIAEEAATPVSA